ncbi:hypothetical protein VPH35_106217 [Triticum aestivum]
MVAPMVIAAAGLGMLAGVATANRTTGDGLPAASRWDVALRAAAPAGRSASAAVGPTATSAAGRAPAPDASGAAAAEALAPAASSRRDSSSSRRSCRPRTGAAETTTDVHRSPGGNQKCS